MMRSNKSDEKLLQEWTDELQAKAQRAERTGVTLCISGIHLPVARSEF